MTKTQQIEREELPTNTDYVEGIPEHRHGSKLVAILAVYQDGTAVRYQPSIMEWENPAAKPLSQ